MDCIEAREVISEAFDRGVADTPQAAEARRHCRSCAECRTFVEGLALLRKTPPPQAPPDLVESIVERGRKMAEAGLIKPVVSAEEPAQDAAADGAETPEQPAAPVFDLEPVARRRDERDKWWWGTRIAASVAAVVIAAFAVSLAIQGFRALPGASSRGGGQLASSGASGGTRANVPEAAPAVPADSQAKGGTTNGAQVLDAGGARYVDLGGAAYVWIGQRTPDRTSLEEAGNITSSLDGSSTAETWAVWRSKTDADVLFVKKDPSAETYLAFRAVYRTYGGRPYALSSGDGIPAFGVWPSLPSSLATPTASDGSPTFIAAGKDDTGLPIYAPAGDAPADGFAVAPGTALTDPAGGNPNWTWWVPKK